MGVKQEIAEMRIPALNAYMKVSAAMSLGPWEGMKHWEGEGQMPALAWPWELGWL
jgi:hypothetical protein